VVQRAAIVVETEQQRTHHRAFSVLVPAEAGDDAVGRPRVLDLDHRALARLVEAALRLRDHAVEPGAFEARKPLGRDLDVAGHRRQMHRRNERSERVLEQPPALRLRYLPQIAAVDREQVERDEGSRRFLRQLVDAGGRGVQPKLQRVEVEPLRRRDDNLAVDDQAWRQLVEHGAMHFREIPIERLQIAALDEDVVGAAKGDCAKAVPLGLVEVWTLGQRVRQLREHRLDRRRDGEARGVHVPARAGSASRDPIARS